MRITVDIEDCAAADLDGTRLPITVDGCRGSFPARLGSILTVIADRGRTRRFRANTPYDAHIVLGGGDIMLAGMSEVEASK